MKILVSIENKELEQSDVINGSNVIYRPDIERWSSHEQYSFLLENAFEGAVLPKKPPMSVVEAWLNTNKSCKALAYHIGLPSGLEESQLFEYSLSNGSFQSISNALAAFETWYCRITQEPLLQPKANTETILVGAGIVNLITALTLSQNGIAVTIVDSSPPPGSDWRLCGCTHAGDDARMFTLTEMDSYNNQNAFSNAKTYFRKPISDGGWLATSRKLSEPEKNWIETFENLPSFLANSYKNDIFSLNLEAMWLWETLRQNLGSIFSDAVTRDQVIRIYSHIGDLSKAVDRHKMIGATAEYVTMDELRKSFASFGIRNEDFASGALRVPGFTVNVHKLTQLLIQILQDQYGVSVSWNTCVENIRRTPDGLIETYEVGGEKVSTHNLVVSAGAYGNDLLKGTPCHNKIQGVLGGWKRLPCEKSSLQHSLKISDCGHVNEDANITICSDGPRSHCLIIGSGYGYVGLDNESIDPQELAAIESGILQTAKKFFPQLRSNSSKSNSDYEFKYCVRPWTATSLGLFHSEVMSSGATFIANGGHNTGGFAQAPIVAEAVNSTLNGKSHAMQYLYNPNRYENFLASDTINNNNRLD